MSSEPTGPEREAVRLEVTKPTPDEAKALEQLWDAAVVCTEAELKALRVRESLRRRGLPDGYRSVARALGVNPRTARDLLIQAERRLGRAAAG